MSGIGDGDNSDLQRIREVNQAALRRQAEQAKRSHQARAERSFKEVMAEQARERTAQQAQRETAPANPQRPRDGTTNQRLLAQVRQQGQRAHTDLNKKAALSRGLAGAQARGRAKGHRTDATAAESRAEELVTRTSEELDRVKESARDEDVRDIRALDEKQAEVAQNGDGRDVDPDGRRQNQQQREGAASDDRVKTEGVEGSDGPRAARRVNVPPALIQQIVSAVYKVANADGRTQMHVHLRGGPLDGVKLEVRADGGQVQCTFHGCDKEMAGLLKEGRTALAQGLAKRGLKLAALNIA